MKFRSSPRLFTRDSRKSDSAAPSLGQVFANERGGLVEVCKTITLSSTRVRARDVSSLVHAT